jgi:hypothetical protein
MDTSLARNWSSSPRLTLPKKEDNTNPVHVILLSLQFVTIHQYDMDEILYPNVASLGVKGM